MAGEIDPGMADPSTPVGKVVLGGIGITGLLGLIYKARQLLRADRNESRQDNREHAYLTNLEKRVKELEERADRFAGERNVAIEKAARLEGEVKRLEDRISHLEQEKATASLMLGKVEEMHRALTDENEALRAKLVDLQKVVDRRFQAPRPEMAAPTGWEKADG